MGTKIPSKREKLNYSKMGVQDKEAKCKKEIKKIQIKIGGQRLQATN